MMQQTVSGSLSNSYLNSLFKFFHFVLDAASVDDPSSTFNLIAAANNHASWDTTAALDSKSNIALRSPELSDSIHMLSVKVMHTAVTGGSHHIPSDPSHHINFAWASGALRIFIIPHFLQLLVLLHGLQAPTQTQMCQPARPMLSPLHRCWQIIPHSGMLWPSLAYSTVWVSLLLSFVNVICVEFL